MAKRWVIGEDSQLVEYGTQPFVWEPVVVLESDYDAAEARIRELEAAIKAAIENEVSLDSERGSTWHILNDALAKP